jgi:hypothetical protein
VLIRHLRLRIIHAVWAAGIVAIELNLETISRLFFTAGDWLAVQDAKRAFAQESSAVPPTPEEQ